MKKVFVRLVILLISNKTKLQDSRKQLNETTVELDKIMNIMKKHNKHTNFITVKQTWKDYFVIYDKQKQNLNKTILNKCTIYYKIINL
jgi:hypothetical protein